MTFENALETNNNQALKTFDKVDLHNHGLLSCTRKWATDGFVGKDGKKMPFDSVKTIDEFLDYFKKQEKPSRKYLYDHNYFLLYGNLQNCVDTGIKVVSPSIPYRTFKELFISENDADTTIWFLQQIENQFPQLKILWDIGIPREKYDKQKHGEFITSLIQSKFFSGIDLYGAENGNPNELFVDFFKQSNDIGMSTKVHAGEQLGADYVEKCINDFNPKQIQHGYRIIEDERVVELARQKGIVFNVCPTSSVRLGVVKSMKDHPIKKMYESGLKITIGTDDLLFFESDINNEYLELYKNGVLSRKELNQIRESGLQFATQKIKKTKLTPRSFKRFDEIQEEEGVRFYFKD
ncbi:MAG: hypothetical protein LBG88_01705 [Christensenellaceae bacterium]|jgi:adenosine deaminase|nr:hypothetical protein [Christensenellaceae bacterium]